MGIKDYSDYKQDRWYQSTTDEINGHVPQGASLHAVLDKGGNTLKELVSPATLNAAYLRDWQSYDSGVLADIWVRTAASKPPTVNTTGSPSVTNGTGYTTYSFSGGSKGRAALKRIDYNAYVDSGNLQGCDTAIAYTTTTLPNAVSKPANPTKVKSVTGKYYGQPRQLKYGDSIQITANSNNLYDCTTWENCYQASGVSRSSIAMGAYVNGGSSSSGGSVTVNNYTPEVVSKKVLQPASLNPEKTRDRNWCYYTRVPGSAETKTKTFLVQGGTAALQNFAFDMMEEE